MTTITERMEYASAAAHDFADAAMVQLFKMLGIYERIGDKTAAKHHPVLLAALIEAAAKTYAIERQCESAERIADALRDIADALKGNTAPSVTHRSFSTRWLRRDSRASRAGLLSRERERNHERTSYPSWLTGW